MRKRERQWSCRVSDDEDVILREVMLKLKTSKRDTLVQCVRMVHGILYDNVEQSYEDEYLYEDLDYESDDYDYYDD